MTSGLLRCANNQMGMTYEELSVFVETVMSKLRIPEWLQGPVTEEDDAWQIYLKETLDKCLDFCTKLNMVVLGPYLLVVIMSAGVTRKSSILTGSLFRLVMTHGILLVIGYQVLNHIQQSQFAVDLRAKRMLMRAFPVKDTTEDVTVPSGPLALPERDDVLVGSRFDARFLGAFDRWLEYHPGNKVFRAAVADNAEYYGEYSGLPDVFRNQIINNVLSLTTRRGRYLSQDYQFGLWIVMSDAEARNYVRDSFLARSSELLTDLNQEISYILADYRFGLKRGTVLAAFSQEYLLHWRNDVLFPRTTVEPAVPWPLVTYTEPLFSYNSRLQDYVPKAHSDIISIMTSSELWTDIPTPPSSFEVGDVVMALDGGKWYRGSIMGETHKGKLIISFEEGGTDYVWPEYVRPVIPIEEGTRVRVQFRDEGWFAGSVSYVHPNRDINVEYDDGDYNEAVPFWKYEVIVE